MAIHPKKVIGIANEEKADGMIIRSVDEASPYKYLGVDQCLYPQHEKQSSPQTCLAWCCATIFKGKSQCILIASAKTILVD